ncbi:hypothetical protein GCM10011594_43900 [Nakamurella endophytica]|uniref:Uncharacterized protein n=1 Tax=Nakamurella endophytica TaxID=1748367 RepID=A0A917TDA8_9ACTN|nr:hypothetical protein GCM10011594_43900 [Nakamurella endophytica]
MTVPLLVAARAMPRLVARLGDRAVLAAAFVVTAAGLMGAAGAIHHGYPDLRRLAGRPGSGSDLGPADADDRETTSAQDPRST